MSRVDEQQLFIGGKFESSSANAFLETVDPSTGRSLAGLPRGTAEDVARAVDAAVSARRAWRSTKPVDRARVLSVMGARLIEHRSELAQLESLDTGKPLKQAMADVVVAARYFEYYAGVADKLFGTTVPLGDEFLDYTLREPLGVSAQIVPWNYPIQIGCRGIAPALAAGCTVVVKPAEEASLSLLRAAELTLDAGLPPGALNIVTGLGAEAGAKLTAHPGIDQITFTGSVETGQAIMRAAADNVVPVVLELGGKSPVLVFDDADLDAAAASVLSANIQHAGQTCSAVTRLIAAQPVRERLVAEIAKRMRAVTIAPGVEDPDLGPLITAGQLERVAGYVDDAVASGIQVAAGGEVAEEAEQYGGYFYRPTLLDQVPPDAAVAREEIFGPVLAVLEAADEAEAVALANDSDFGLVCGIWTRDVSRAHRVAAELEAGQIYVNGYGAGGGVELPFGGYKKSGFGREKGMDGLNSYLQTKNVCLKL